MRDDNQMETIVEMFHRVTGHVAGAERGFGGDVVEVASQFYSLLTTFRFLPNSPTFTGAGTPLGQLAACFVLPIDDDMGRDGAGIFQTLRDAALIQQTGGGNGFSFSRLRPKRCNREKLGRASHRTRRLFACVRPSLWRSRPRRNPQRGKYGCFTG